MRAKLVIAIAALAAIEIALAHQASAWSGKAAATSLWALSPDDARASSSLTVDRFLTAGAGEVLTFGDLMTHTEQLLDGIKTNIPGRPPLHPAVPPNPFIVQTPATQPSIYQIAEQNRKEVLAAAQSLTLHSILNSSIGSACVINDMLLREHQEVDGFTVDRINSDSVIVHSGIFRFEIRQMR